MSLGTSLRQRLTAQLAELPVLPLVVVRLLSLDHAEPDYDDQVIRLIASEPNYSARVLVAANSAASSPAAPISSVRAAISRIGTTRAKHLIISAGVTRVFAPRDDWERSLWLHALQVALGARELALAAGPTTVRADDAYTAGLLHDIGRFVMFHEAPDRLRMIDEGSWSEPGELVELERTLCGIDHAELGAVACERWGIPAAITDTVRHHHASHPPSHPDAPLTDLVRAADLLLFASAVPGRPSLADTDDGELDTMVAGLPPALRQPSADLRNLVRRVTHEAAVNGRQLGVVQ